MTQAKAIETLLTERNIEHHETFGDLLDANKDSVVIFENGETEPIDAFGIIRPVRKIRIEIIADWRPEVMNKYPSFRDMGIEAVRESLEKKDIWPWRTDWVNITGVSVEEI